MARSIVPENGFQSTHERDAAIGMAFRRLRAKQAWGMSNVSDLSFVVSEINRCLADFKFSLERDHDGGSILAGHELKILLSALPSGRQP
ncbi:MAG: hypothetical protein LBU72_01165 [Burkholderiaceae bacterium]|jgi:hypothetical protein|nr:hypothetical protein [Burkholderiaceae bacterium]